MSERDNNYDAFDAFDDAVEQESGGSDRLETIERLARRQMELEEQLQELTEKQSQIKKELIRVSQVDLPEAMDEVGMAQLRLANGFEVDIHEGVDANISKANAPEAYAWLEEHGFGDIIKREVKANLGRDNQPASEALKEFLQGAGVPFDEKHSVHPQTLKRFAREQLEKGVDIPEDLFGIYNYRKAKITPAG